MQPGLLGAALLAILGTQACSKKESPLPRLNPEPFAEAFAGGQARSIEGETLSFKVEKLGYLKLPTGQIGAVEPLALVLGMSPFTVKVPPGEYPVIVALTTQPNDSRVAFAKVEFSPEPVAYWQMAIPEGTDTSKLKPGRMIGYPVDGGMGSFLDKQTADRIKPLKEDEGFNKELWASIDNPNPIRTILPADEANVAVFSTGIGDGSYASYFGFSSEGSPVALLTDFNMTAWRETP